MYGESYKTFNLKCQNKFMFYYKKFKRTQNYRLKDFHSLEQRSMLHVFKIFINGFGR